MSKKELTWGQQLVVLRDLTRRFGTLHDAQVLQLKIWPHLVDNHLENSLAEVDFEAKVVKFTWVTENVPLVLDKKYRNRMDSLASNVKYLLGDDWSIAVHRDSILIYPIGDKNAVRSRKSRASTKRNKRTRPKKRKSR